MVFRDANRLIKDKEVSGSAASQMATSASQAALGPFGALGAVNPVQGNLDPSKVKEIKAHDDLLAYNSGPSILIEPGLLPRGDI